MEKIPVAELDNNLTAEQDLGLLPESQSEAPIEVSPQKFSPIIKVKLTADQENKIVSLIKSEHNKIVAEYEEYNNGQGWFNHIDETNKILETAKDVDGYDDRSDKNLSISLIAADVVASKDKRQTMGISPVVILEQLEDVENISQLRDREDRLDYILRNDCGMEEVNYQSVPRACLNGVAIIKTGYEKKVEYRTRKVLYKPDASGIAEFEEAYGGGEIAKPGSKAAENYALLMSGQEVEITDVEPVVVFNGVKPYRVDPKNFYARLYKKDFQTHRVISERIDEVSFSDIEQGVTGDDFGYDQEAVDKLREKIGSDEKTVSEWKADKYESIVYIKLESELKEGEKPKKEYAQRYLVTFEDQYKTVLRCIHYPYEHGKVCYTALTALPRDDSWTGWSFAVRDADMESMANGLLNSLMNEFKIAENGVILTDDSETDYSRVPVANGDGLSVIKLKQGAKFQQMAWTFPHVDRVGLINWATNHAALMTGVDPAIQSGAETPSDPSAPYAKSALKQANSNARIEDIILNLQKGYERYVEQIESIYRQFVDVDAEDGIKFFRGEKSNTVNDAAYNVKVRYVCQGSRLSFDKNADSSAVIGLATTLAKLSPETIQDKSVAYALARILVNNTGGSVERAKDIILKPLKLQSESQQEMRNIAGQLPPEVRTQLNNLPPEQQKRAMEIFMQGGEGGQMPPDGMDVQPQPEIAPQGNGGVPMGVA